MEKKNPHSFANFTEIILIIYVIIDTFKLVSYTSQLSLVGEFDFGFMHIVNYAAPVYLGIATSVVYIISEILILCKKKLGVYLYAIVALFSFIYSCSIVMSVSSYSSSLTGKAPFIGSILGVVFLFFALKKKNVCGFSGFDILFDYVDEDDIENDENILEKDKNPQEEG